MSIYDTLNEQQREAVYQTEGPVLILAGAGSGKTRVLTHRTAYLIEEKGVNPYHIMAITFTNKAAGEMRERIDKIVGFGSESIWVSTFHSSCVRILRRHIDRIGFDTNFTIYDADDSKSLMKDICKRLEIDTKIYKEKSFLAAISSAKDELITPTELMQRALTSSDYAKRKQAEVYREYQEALHKNNALDFDDLIMKTVELLQSDPEVKNYYQERFHYIMVDEYQDTNQAQFRLVSLLSSKHNNLCVVGDDDQSIYKFRGATIENILSFEKQFAGSRVIRLEQNYRSTQTILDAANSVIKNNSSRKPKELWTDSGQGDKIIWYKAQDERDEASFVASKVMEYVKNGGRFGDNAVLYRMNAQSNLIEQAFVKSGVPYRVFGGMRFYDRKEIKDITSYMAVINNNNDSLRMRRIINEPKRGIGDSTLALLDDITGDLGLTPLEVMRNADEYPMLAKKSAALKKTAAIFDYLAEFADENPLDKFFDELLKKTGYLEYMKSLGDEGITRLENINELKSTIISYMEDAEEPSLNGFLEEIALYTDIDKMDADADAVVMMTVHSAKGLEFTNVFAVGMEDGIFPSGRCFDSEEELEEERRLAYVAITRAKERLFLSSASQRMLFGTTQRNFTSRFIKEIDKNLIEKKDNTIVGKSDKPPVQAVKSMSLQQQLAKNKSKSVPSASAALYSAGERVKHNIFGEGTILSVKQMASDAMLEIAFEKVGTKKIMATFAKLQKI